jgi:hypothetical protein
MNNFSESYYIFYAFLKFIQISEIIKENKNGKPMHSIGLRFGTRPRGLAQLSGIASLTSPGR